MTDTLATASDEQTTAVLEALEDLLAAHDPVTTDRVVFLGERFDRGLAFVHFPVGFGGLGVRPELQTLVERRLRERRAPQAEPAQFFMYLAGPTIVTHGTDEQKRRFLRPMFTGEERWCQLFSEPGAGSDFASLGARAVLDGDEWVVNGQKVWNTLAHLADWGMLVTRTDPDLPKHKGMTYFAVDMRSEGVEVRPLRQITGEAEFNEVYLTDARIPDENRIGAVGEGWRVALTTLMNERTAIGGGGGGGGRGSGPIAEAVRIWNAIPEAERRAADRDRLLQLWCRSETLRLTNVRAGANRKAGNPGPEGSIAKLAMADLNKRIYELCIDLLGPEGLVGFDFAFRRPEELSVDGSNQGPRHAFLRSRANSIEGGTSEIMRNILGEQVLGLPGEPRVDKALPWKDVPRS
ncbi:MAG: acyl-CoA dehydrogenase family protein [Acidimicrobiales bacterium]|jgi:alkylation response protein AidB-like acyl-CoA dehydrogenase|nr:acyl-CoA dehydrogenase family protein [Acidimicrobiales bacterium]